ncbi:MAG: hypothetical protein KIH80_005400 [Flavobacteriia bacterium]|nr:hypothetical protein [Flavobacteriia bacterium]
MKYYKLSLFLLGFVFISCDRSNEETYTIYKEVFTARLVNKGLCLHDTFTIESENFDFSLVADWTHPVTDVTYKNAFALKNLCELPETINEGDVIKFILIDKDDTPDCINCLAISPTPPKKLFIKYVE